MSNPDREPPMESTDDSALETEPARDPAKEAAKEKLEADLKHVDEALDLTLPGLSEDERHVFKQWIREHKNWPEITELLTSAKSALDAIESARITDPETVEELENKFIEKIGIPIVNLWRENESPSEKKEREGREKALRAELTALRIHKNQLIAEHDRLVSAAQYEAGVPKDVKKYHPATLNGRERIFSVQKEIVKAGLQFWELQKKYKAETGHDWPHPIEVLAPALEKADGVDFGTYDLENPGIKAMLESMPQEEIEKRIEQGVKRDEDRRAAEKKRQELADRAKREKGDGKDIKEVDPKVHQAHDRFADVIQGIMAQGSPWFAGAHEKRQKAFLAGMEQVRAQTPETTNAENTIEDILFAAAQLVRKEGKVKNFEKVISINELAEISKDIYTYKFKGDEKVFQVIRKLPSLVQELERTTKDPNRRKLFKEMRKKLIRLREGVA